MPRPSLLPKIALSTMPPMMRDRKMTKVFTTPWISVRVTMSPLAMWAISWPSTASTSFCRMDCSRPVLTATSALLRLAPVAKALGCGDSKMPTSGMPMPARCAWARIVSTSHCSVLLAGCSMTRTPMERLAIHLDRNSEMSAPPNPNRAAKTSRPPRSLPREVMYWSMPRRRATTESTRTTARLVARNRKIRFIVTTASAGE